MPKTNINHQVASAPMRVLINKKSEKVLKDTFNDEVPQTLVYSLEDFRMLYDMFKTEFKDEHPGDVSLIRVYMLIQEACSWEIDNNTAVFFKFHKERKDRTLGQVYNMIFKTKLKDIPLKIHHPYYYLIAKWRLLINK